MIFFNYGKGESAKWRMQDARSDIDQIRYCLRDRRQSSERACPVSVEDE